MRQFYILISLIILLIIFGSFSPLETKVNGQMTDLKTVKLSIYDKTEKQFKTDYYVEASGLDVPYSKSIKIFGTDFIPSSEIIDNGGRFEIDGFYSDVMYTPNRHFVDENVKYLAKTQGMDFLVYENGTFNEFFVKGVNIGAAKPGYFPGELSITKEEYLKWFQYIEEMGANTIRVYTTLMPEFYEALYEFNYGKEKPLYLIHGVWVNEEDTITLLDAYGEEGKILKEFIKDAKDIVDILHGNASLPKRVGFASGEYKFDVSNYVIGWILGTEWDPYFVNSTNSNYIRPYDGTFLYTENASAFENFLAEVGDKTIAYEYQKYGVYRPTAFSNWLTTDPLTHPNEPMEVEDMATVDTEHIKAKEGFKSGLFASYHVYPYYPEFINSDLKYRANIDSDGEVNTYEGYLKDLISHHTIPVIVAEFGIPSSRAKAHDAVPSGYNQGKHSEEEQGEILIDMFTNIYETGYCGGIMFSWQDEWFKKTWNTMDFDDEESRAYWSNPQTNEQHFGLLSFDPGEIKSICYVDGEKEDWINDKPLLSQDGIDLYMKSDEKYVYLAIDNYKLGEKTINIPIDTIKNQGNDSYKDLKFSQLIDFIIEIDGTNNSRIIVDQYYDTYTFQYGEKPNKNTGVFNKMYLSLNRALYFPEEMKHVETQKYETGILLYGNGNPDDENFNSLADFYNNGDFLEIRIPWQLFNVMNPAKKYIMDDMYLHNDFIHLESNGFMVGINESIMYEFNWDGWDLPTYHERLKQSYYILKDFLPNFAN